MGGKDLHGQVAIVTGATQGISKTIAARFVKEGARLFLVDVDEDTVRKTANDLNGTGKNRIGTCKIYVCDSLSVDSAVDDCVQVFCGIDLLVNNAGIVGRGKIESISLQDYKRILYVNLNGLLMYSRSVIPYMRSSGGDVILNVSSVNARLPDIGLATYSEDIAELTAFMCS